MSRYSRRPTRVRQFMPRVSFKSSNPFRHHDMKEREHKEFSEHHSSKLTYAERKALPSKDFVYPKTRRYPIENKSHARNALARVSQFGTPEEKRKVCRAVHKRYPSIHEKHCPHHG